MRENRTHGSEGGDGESRLRPLSEASCQFVAQIVPHMHFLRRSRSIRIFEIPSFVNFVSFVVNQIRLMRLSLCRFWWVRLARAVLQLNRDASVGPTDQLTVSG